MRRANIVVSVGTRPEAIKMAPVVHVLQRADWCDVRVVATGQHREMLDQVMAFFEIEPDADLNLMRPSQSLGDLTARMVADMTAYLGEAKPDVVLVQGDTTTVFVTALACFYQGIATGHVEAGLRTGKKHSPFPEEMNRQLVGRLADWHFAPTDGSAANLLREGVPEDRVLVTGNTVIDALLWAAKRVDEAPYRATEGKHRILVTAHRRENFGEPVTRICTALRALADRGDTEILYPVHLNPNIKEPVERALGDHPAIQLVAPLDYPEFVAAMKASHLILTDSGGVQEEAPSLGVPVLVMRENTERPEGLDAGTSILVGTSTEVILERATGLLDDAAAHGAMAQRANPYGDGTAAQRIADALRTQLCE